MFTVLGYSQKTILKHPISKIKTPTGISGTWVNKDPNTRGITKVIISKNESQIHTYGKCSPRDCDWKTTALKKYKSRFFKMGTLYRAIYDQGFGTKEIFISKISTDEIVLKVSAKYRDKRSDKNSTYYMRKSTNDNYSTLIPFSNYATIPITAGTTTRYGTYGFNICVPDVPAAFERASGSRHMRKSYQFAPTDKPLNRVAKPEGFSGKKDHIQGIARISGLGTENYFAMTRNSREGVEAGVYIGRFEGIESNGGAWASANVRVNNMAQKYYYYRFGEHMNHGGGLQALGSMLFIGVDGHCNQDERCPSTVKIMDARLPQHAKWINNLVLDGSQGELSSQNTRTNSGKVISVKKTNAFAVAAIPLENNHYLLFVRGGSSYGWFYISTTPYIGGNTKWKFLDFWHQDDLKPGAKWYSYENINFIADCNGSIYMVGMGTSDNASVLYRLTSRYNSRTKKRTFNFEYINKRGLNTDAPGRNFFDWFEGPIIRGILGLIPITVQGYTPDQLHEMEGLKGVTLRNGGGIHLTSDKGLVSYATGRKPTIQIDEFRPHEEQNQKRMSVASIAIPLKKSKTNSNTNNDDNFSFDFRKMKVLKVTKGWAVTDGKTEAVVLRTREDAEKAIDIIKKHKGIK